MIGPCPNPFNMAAHVLAQAKAQPDKTALSVLGAQTDDWSYARLTSAVLGTATGLLARGLVPGDRILLRLCNTPDFPILYLACIAVGVIPVPTSAQLTVPEITQITADIGPALIVAAPGIALPDHPCPVIEAADLAAMRNLPPARPVMGDPHRPAYIIYTSGTSGRPRAVVHAHRAIWARRMMHAGWEGLTATDRLLHAGAFNWTYTLGTGLMDPWVFGATALIPADGTPIGDLPQMLAAHDATIFAGAPGVFRQMLRHPMPPLPTLRHALSAGEKLSDDTRLAWERATGTAIHEAYGLSECSTFISGSPERPAPPGTLGLPQPGRQVAIMADGTIAVHRNDPGLMLGYLNQPADTAARFAGDWFLTGDMGEHGPDGAITYLGRTDDMMNAGGYRVSPIEIETALACCRGLTEVAACEVTVKPGTSVIAAFYVAADVLDADALAAHAASCLARYKHPRLYVRVPALPRGANNKLLRRKLRADWEAVHGQT